MAKEGTGSETDCILFELLQYLLLCMDAHMHKEYEALIHMRQWTPFNHHLVSKKRLLNQRKYVLNGLRVVLCATVETLSLIHI